MNTVTIIGRLSKAIEFKVNKNTTSEKSKNSETALINVATGLPNGRDTFLSMTKFVNIDGVDANGATTSALKRMLQNIKTGDTVQIEAHLTSRMVDNKTKMYLNVDSINLIARSAKNKAASNEAVQANQAPQQAPTPVAGINPFEEAPFANPVPMPIV